MEFIKTSKSGEVTDITIPEGECIRIEEKSTSRILWEKDILKYFPVITPDQSYQLSADRINYYTVQGENVTVGGKIKTVNWSSSEMPSGLSIEADSGTITGKPTVTGEYSPRVKVENNYGSDEKSVNLTIPIPASWAPQEPDEVQFIFPFIYEAMPEYQVLYKSEAPKDTAYTWEASWDNLLNSGMRINSYTGAVYSVDNFYGRLLSNPVRARDFILYGGTIRSAQGYITLTNDYGVATIKICVIPLDDRGFKDQAPMNYRADSLIVLSGLPIGINKVGGKGKFEYAYIPSLSTGQTTTQYVIPDPMPAMKVKTVNLTGSSNLSISGDTVTAKTAGDAWVIATAQAPASSTGTISVKTTWTIYE